MGIKQSLAELIAPAARTIAEKLEAYSDSRDARENEDQKSTASSIEVLAAGSSPEAKHVAGEVWIVNSESGNGTFYEVRTGEPWSCECPDFRFNRQAWKKGARTCKHIAEVIRTSGEIPSLPGVNPKWLSEYLGDIRTGLR